MTNAVFTKKQAHWPTTAEESIPLTAPMYQSLQAEQQALLQEQDEVIERLKVAREMGDLSENGAYKYAKFELGRVRRRLGEINRILKRAIILTKPQGDSVEFGSAVTVTSQGGERTFLLVSEYEADPTQAKLSDKSPIGAAVKGHKLGETVTAQLPSGATEFTITKIA